MKLDVSDAAVGEQMTANAHMHLALLLVAGDVHFAVLFECGFSCRQGFLRKYNLAVVVGVRRTRDGSSFSMTRKSLFIVVIGLNFSTGGLVQSVRTISVWMVLGVRLPHGEY